MDEKILLRVWPEFESTGIWMPPNPSENNMGQMMTYESLELPNELADAFMQWQERYSDRPLPDDGTFDWEAFDKEGLELAKELKNYKLYDFSVQYWMNGSWQKIYGYDVMADYSASLWDDKGVSSELSDIEYDLNGYTILNRDELQEAFDQWERDFDKSLDNTLDWEVFNAEGNRLVDELQSRLPEYCTVRYMHAFEETHPPFKAAPTAI